MKRVLEDSGFEGDFSDWVEQCMLGEIASHLHEGKLIEAIAGITSPIVKDKFQRNETVIKLLKKFNFEPDHPPADFSGVYAYALVEYGIGKPKAFLQLFQQEEIKRAFRQAFDHNNPSILLSEADDFVEAYALGAVDSQRCPSSASGANASFE